MSDIERPVRRVETKRQLSLLEGSIPEEQVRRAERNDSGFVDPDPAQLYFGSMKLSAFLKQMELGWVIGLRDFVRSLDFTEFEQAYSLQGRPPYAPAAMVGLILYGLMKGRCSLRELEEMARSDLGAMWMSGGIFPDHSVLGRFLARHQQVLSVDIFEDLTRRIIQQCDLDTSILAGDGTIIEAAASRYRTVELEAAEAYADKLRAELCERDDGDDDSDDGLEERLAQAEEVVAIGRERAREQGRSATQTAKLQVVATEPEAALLCMKRGGYAPGYTPSIMANQDRVIVALGMDATSEFTVFDSMVEQASRVRGEEVGTLLMDANYHRLPIVETALEHGVDLLCPPKDRTPRWRSKAADKPAKFTKHDFTYLPDEDVLICPASKRLNPGGFQSDEAIDRSYRVFYSDRTNCRRCPLRAECTTSPRGRRVKRFAGDEKIEALRQVMKQPAAQARYGRRMAMVEPAYAGLKENLGLTRFRRFGLAGAMLEFALSAMAHNLRRWKKLGGPSGPNRRLNPLLAILTHWLRSLRQTLNSCAKPLASPTVATQIA